MSDETSLLRSKFEQAHSFDGFLKIAEAEQQRDPWDQRYSQLALDDDQLRLVQSFQRQINVLCLTGTWCGDCALQGAAMQRIAEANGRINLRFLQRGDEHADLIVKCQINAGFRVPVTWFMAEDFAPVSRIGDRTLSRYRSMARKALPEGAPGGVTVIAPAPADPVREVLREVLEEFERVHLLLRLSGRLRQKYND